ncbi:MAG: hypothetical protein AB7J28_14235 [Hyphomonadaceae bacterium]
MSEPQSPLGPETPPPPAQQGEVEASLYAKRRLPFEERGARANTRHPGLTAAAALYGVAMLVAFGVAGYMAVVQRHEFVSVPVLASIAIGIWFAIRMTMMLRPQKPRED